MVPLGFFILGQVYHEWKWPCWQKWLSRKIKPLPFHSRVVYLSKISHITQVLSDILVGFPSSGVNRDQLSWFCKDGLHLSKWVGAQLAKWRKYLVLARRGRFGLREPERTLLASYLSRVTLVSLLERKNNFKRPGNKMSDHLNATHARLAFLGEWCTPKMCLVFLFFLFALTAAPKKWCGFPCE